MSELQLVNATESRAETVTLEVRQIKSDLANRLIYLGELLSESRSNGYPEQLGFESFGAWLEDSGLDMSERQAYYLVKIVDNAKQLGIPRKSLEASKMSKLKEIFSLNPDEHGNRMRDLVEASADLKLEEVRQEVATLRSGVGLEPTSWFNFRVTDSQKQQISHALATARMEYGQNVDPNTGDVTEAPNATLLADVICNAYLQSIDQPVTIEGV